LAAVPARADAPGPQSIAEAEALFQEGKRLMATGNYGAACPKLAESQRLDPGGGTLITLALCHEAEGKTASAWAEFGEALTIALKDGRVDRATVAREHGAKLEPKLSHLVVRVPSNVSMIEGVQVSQDGIELGRAAWGTALPVDPGEHVVEARLPGHKPWMRFVVIAPAGDRQELEVGPLVEDAPPASPAVAREAPGVTAQNPRRTVGWIAGGASVALLGGATYFGVRAIDDHSTANHRCPTSPCHDRAGVDANDDSRKEATLSTIGFVAGGATLGAALYLLLTTSSQRAASARPRFVASPIANGAYAAWSTSW
jgi:hypothetical protein